MGCGCAEIDVVVTGTGTNDDLQLLGGIEHLGIDLVGAYDEGVDILHGIEQLLLLGVFLEQCQLMACCFNLFANTFDGSCCERLLGCN